VKRPFTLVCPGTVENGASRALPDRDTTPHWVSHSTTGWMTEGIFAESLEHLRQHIRDGEQLRLLVDSYAAHERIT
jgi:hypothetical protein